MIVEYICIICQKECRKKRSPGNLLVPPKFCSQACRGKFTSLNKKGPTQNFKGICEFCKKEFTTYRSPSNMKLTPRFCSLVCLGKSQKGENNPAYNGGKYKCNGYYIVFVPEHPFASDNTVLEHRLVMEKKLGRYLTSEEVVHHIDRNKLNNDINNLMLFPSNSEHLKYHARENKLRKQLQNEKH
jgi:hypothetical protein